MLPLTVFVTLLLALACLAYNAQDDR